MEETNRRGADEGDGPRDRLILRGGIYVDGAGSPPLGPVDIVIENDRIVQIQAVGLPHGRGRAGSEGCGHEHVPARQWVLSVPKRLRPHVHDDVRVGGAVLQISLRAIRATLRRYSLDELDAAGILTWQGSGGLASLNVSGLPARPENRAVRAHRPAHAPATAPGPRSAQGRDSPK